ncbi:ThuA domain-containing protein [Flindersiella endophytica]
MNIRHAAALTLAATLAVPLAMATLMPGTANAAPAFDVLVFSKTAGFRHDSIPDGIAMVQRLGAAHRFSVDATEDAAAFTPENLGKYEAVIWLSTTGDVLDDTQQAAFEGYIQAGGGYVGIHAASDTEYSWPWYGNLVGAYFQSHPAIQPATVKVEDPVHPSTRQLPARWQRTDEWYNYRANPRGNVHVLAELDEKSYTGGGMGTDHPIAWCQDYDGGRAWYTGGGHTKESYTEPAFEQHVLEGIRTAAGAKAADCGGTDWSNYEKVTLDDNTLNPMALAVLPDGRVLYVERLGEAWVWKPDTEQRVAAATFDVFTDFESGLLGIAVDPKFARNKWVYVYYSPTGIDVDRLSRFTMRGDTIDLASEKVVLDVPVQRVTCCHHGGALEFGPDGTLYLSTGDNSNPFESQAYAPIDERAGREPFDAQRSAANTNSLSGKVLRIRPSARGGYTIPLGNLFRPGTPKTRPEIYAMGLRNPFRFGIDKKTGYIAVADYGPDANQPSATRGPEGRVEWNLMKRPGNYGWPYCHGGAAYNDYDFATGVSGALFDCASPVNESPNNTGLVELPPVIQPDIWYGRLNNSPTPELGTGGAPMGGPVYRYDPKLRSDRKWPAYWDGKAIFGEWGQNRMYSFQLDSQSTLVDVNQILTTMQFQRPMDFDFGPDGALYLIEWGSGFGGNNDTSGVYRIDYVKGNRSPIAQAAADRTSGSVPLTVQFSGAGSRDPDGQPITYAWDFDSNGTVDSTAANPSYTYASIGNYTARLTVTDTSAKTGVANVPIVAGNTAPTVSFTYPPDGGLFSFGDHVRFSVTVTDPEDGTIDCGEVTVATSLGHNDHDHGFETYPGCSAVVETHGEDSHGEEENLVYVLTASYTDHGGPGGAQALTTREVQILQPKRKQAEFYTTTGRVPGGAGDGDPGVQRETTGDVEGGFQNIGFIEDGDWFAFSPLSLLNVDAISFRAASASDGGTIDVRAGAPDGPLVGSVDVPNTGDWQTYNTYTATLTDPPADAGSLYLVVRRPAGSTNTGGVLNVNWLDFTGAGVTEPAT